jgi:signal transduction histidine kinase
VGIEAKNIDLIFEKFFRAYDPGLHSTGTYKFMGAGPGLGLTIAKGVIEGHGGKIWAESPGHSMETYPGTTFYVLLPVSPPENARKVMAIEGQSSETAPSDVTLMQSRTS